MNIQDVQISKDTNNKTADVQVFKEPELSKTNLLKQVLENLLEEVDHVNIELHVQEELNVGLIELCIALKKMEGKQVKISIVANDDIRDLVNNAGLLTILEN